ncbi:hypothetical protein Tco_1029133 [Tanacetum coccineum]|uniref:Uncharacterized protein n=1 Tax=Tanacetum coccineum TaxID=301880 RepID=A0ABQ5G4T7_9ASTR
MAPLVSTKFVLGLVACQVSYRVGPSSDLDTGSCTRAREVMMFCTIKSKPLALPWGRTPRLSSGVRVSTHICQRMSECLILGFPSISATLVVVGVGPLSGKGPRIIVFADASVLPRITSLKCVLTQEHLNAVCAKYFVPEEVHPQLPNSDATMHERPAGKVGMYTRFFDYANYLPPQLLPTAAAASHHHHLLLTAVSTTAREHISLVQPEILKNVGKAIATFLETFKHQRAALIWVTTSAVMCTRSRDCYYVAVGIVIIDQGTTDRTLHYEQKGLFRIIKLNSILKRIEAYNCLFGQNLAGLAQAKKMAKKMKADGYRLCFRSM